LYSDLDPVSTDLEITSGVNEQVFRLEVAVDEVKRMEILEGEHYLRAVEA
jgi:hypothetical protein